MQVNRIYLIFCCIQQFFDWNILSSLLLAVRTIAWNEHNYLMHMFINSYVENCQEDSHRPHQCQHFSGIKNPYEQAKINRISLLRIHFINSMNTIYTTPIYFEGYSYLKFNVSLCCHSNLKTSFGSYFYQCLHYFQIKELHRITNQSKPYSPPLDNTTAYENAIKCVIVFLSVFFITLINPLEYVTTSRITYRKWTEQYSYF